MNSPAALFSTRELLVFYYKYRARLFCAFMLPFLLAVALSFVPVPRYPASSVLVVRLGSEYVYQPETGVNQSGPQATIPFNRDQIFKAEVAILASDDLHEQVINAIGLRSIYPEMFHPGTLGSVEAFISKIDPDLLTPEIVDTIQNAVDQTREMLGVPREPMSAEEIAQRRMAEAVVRFNKRLDIFLEKESSVITVTYEHRDAAMAVEALDMLLDLYMQKRKALYLESRVQRAQVQADEVHARALAAQKAVEDYKSANKIYSLQDERLSLIQQRGEVEKQLATLTSSALSQKIGYFNKQLDRLAQLENELESLKHDAQVAEDEYAIFAHRLGEARAYEDLEHERVGSVRIIQAPSAPPDPNRLQPLILLMGFIFSLLSVLVVAALTEFFSDGFLTPERLERDIGLPVLAVLPYRRK